MSIRRVARVTGPVLDDLALWVAGSERGTPGQAGSPRVEVVPLTVESLPFRDSPERPDRDQVLERLAAEATARAERTLLKQHIAGVVERVASPAVASGALVLTGTVRLPVSVPAGQRGGRALFRRGRFASATVTLRRPDGTVAAQGESHLEWDDVWWLRGARVRRARKLDDVLVDTVRKAVDHAVKRLRRPELEAQSR